MTPAARLRSSRRRAGASRSSRRVALQARPPPRVELSAEQAKEADAKAASEYQAKPSLLSGRLLSLWLLQMLQATEDARTRVGVVHRDLRGANVHLSAEGRLLVCGWGRGITITGSARDAEYELMGTYENEDAAVQSLFLRRQPQRPGQAGPGAGRSGGGSTN